MSPSTHSLAGAEVVYPETDGEPMAENTVQFRWIVTIKEGIAAAFRDDPNVFVAGDLFWYPVEGDPATRVAPDVLVAVGRPRGDRPSYLQWLEGNVAPQVVFEILSPGNRPAEMAAKLRFYERFGVEEYYVYDPETARLDGWLRRGAALVAIPETDGWVSPRLGLRFDRSAAELQVFGPGGRRFRTFEELDLEREALERQVADAARQRDEATRQFDAERERAERLAARLRELGVDPDA